MNRNLLEEIQLYEGVKDELIKRIEIERNERNKVMACLCHYRSKHIYTALDTDHCIDMICKYEKEYNVRRERVARLSKELRAIQLELILLYEQYDKLDYLGVSSGGYFM